MRRDCQAGQVQAALGRPDNKGRRGRRGSPPVSNRGLSARRDPHRGAGGLTHGRGIHGGQCGGCR